MAETHTPTLNLSKFAQGERPPILSAAKLNANWTAIDTAIAALLTATSLKAAQAQVDTIQTALDGIIADVAAAHYVKRDGSVAMTGDLDFGTKKGLNVGAPTPGSTQVARIVDVEAAAAAAVNTLGVKKGVRVSRTANQVNGASPTVISWAQADFLYGTMWTIGDPTKVYIRQDGLYDIQGHFIINDGGAGGQVVVRVNGVDVYVFQAVKGNSTFGDTFPYCPVAVTLNLVNGDYVQVFTFGLNGAGAHTVVYAAGVSPFLSVCLSASNASGGGDFLADGSIPLTGNLNLNGFKAIAAADATTPTGLTTLQQVQVITDDLEAQIDALEGAIGATPYVKVKSRRTTGAVSQGATAQVTGVQVTVVLSAPGEVEIKCSFGSQYNPAVAPSSAIGYQIILNGVTPQTPVMIQYCGGGLGALTFFAGCFVDCVTLGAGTHVIKLMHSGNGTTKADATSPAVLIAEYQP